MLVFCNCNMWRIFTYCDCFDALCWGSWGCYVVPANGVIPIGPSSTLLQLTITSSFSTARWSSKTETVVVMFPEILPGMEMFDVWCIGQWIFDDVDVYVLSDHNPWLVFSCTATAGVVQYISVTIRIPFFIYMFYLCGNLVLVRYVRDFFTTGLFFLLVLLYR